MTYRINKSDNSILVDLVDSNIDQISTDLTLIGSDVTGYGEYINENFVHLLENFSNTIQPSNPIIGQLWYDSAQSRLKVYDGTQFKATFSPIVSSTMPLSLLQGDIWIDANNQQMYFYDGTNLKLAGPVYNKQQGISGPVITSLASTDNNLHTVTQLYSANKIIGVISDHDFSSTTIGYSGFIKKGLTIDSKYGLGVGELRLYSDNTSEDSTLYDSIESSRNIKILTGMNNIDVSGSTISNVADPLVSYDATNVKWVKQRPVPLFIGDVTGLSDAEILEIVSQIAKPDDYYLDTICNLSYITGGIREYHTLNIVSNVGTKIWSFA